MKAYSVLINCILCWIAITQSHAAETQYLGRTSFEITGEDNNQITRCQYRIEGQVALILSFSRSTSLAAYRYKYMRLPLEPNDICEQSEITGIKKIPITIDAVNKTFTAVDEQQEQRIIGNFNAEQAQGKLDFSKKTLINNQILSSVFSGQFIINLKKIEGEIIDAKGTTGEVLTAIPLGISSLTDSVNDAGTVLTAKESQTTLIEPDGSEVDINEQSILTRLPLKLINSRNMRRFKLSRGKLNTRIKSTDRDYQIITPGAIITAVNESPLYSVRSDSGIDFSVSYQQTSTNGVTDVVVSSGAVIISQKNGETLQLTAGSEIAIAHQSVQPDWVQPADGGVLYGGMENILAWTAFEGASAYAIEYNLPTPVLSEDTSSEFEYPQQVLYLREEDYTRYDELVVYILDLDEMPEIEVEARVYALDKNLRVIGQTRSSDRAGMTFQ